MVTKGSGDEGKWWLWEVVTTGVWWRREVVTKGSDAAKRIVMAAWMLHGLCFGEEDGARNLVFFRVKWLQAAMKGTSCVRWVRLSSSVFCNKWLRQSCDSDLSADFSILALAIFLLKVLLKRASKSSFFRCGVEISDFGAAIADAVARSSFVFCNSVSADSIVEWLRQGCLVPRQHA